VKVSFFHLSPSRRFVGEFDSPRSHPYNVRKHCIECGEAFWEEIPESSCGIWWHLPGSCGCKQVINAPYYTENFLRSPLEIDQGFSPKDILSEEFLIESLRYPLETLCQHQQQT
jgi:hypothetical protein